MVADEKAELRAEVRARLRAINQRERERASREAVDRLLNSAEFRNAKTILVYDSAGFELDTRPVLEACLGSGKTLCLPRTRAKDLSMAAHRVSDLARDLEVSPFRFREPKAELPIVPAAQLDLIVVPGIAFDERGNRLGRGAGYYDRFLAQPGLRAAVCALAFECQIVPAVPTEGHDQGVGIIYTEARVIRTG